MTARRTILAAIDLSDDSARVLDAAIDAAAGGALHAVFVREPIVDPATAYGVAFTWSPEDDVKKVQELLQQRIEAAISRDGSVRLADATAHVALGPPAREIAHLAAQVDADLVVCGTHSRKGIRRALLGSVAEQVVRFCGCPVLTVKTKAHDRRDSVPEVEPLCEDCAKRRADTGGSELWCARHSEHHVRAHVYHYEGRSTESVRPWGFHG
jgi:nucleotide-binding universal stress UspA family protein